MVKCNQFFIFIEASTLPLSPNHNARRDGLDDLDYAAERSQVFTEAALQSVLSQLAGPPSTGICRSCSDTIETERLRANPRARLCSCCAAEDESHRKRVSRCGPRGN